MRRSKYPSLGILDALYKLTFGEPFESKISLGRDHVFEYMHEHGMPKRIFSKRLYFLKSEGYISKTSRDLIQLTAKGNQAALHASFSSVILKNKKIDAYHRLIIFDIPERFRYARDVLRRKLREFECKQLQRSVYITPYVCESEIGDVARILRVQKYVSVLKVMPL